MTRGRAVTPSVPNFYACPPGRSSPARGWKRSRNRRRVRERKGERRGQAGTARALPAAGPRSGQVLPACNGIPGGNRVPIVRGRPLPQKARRQLLLGAGEGARQRLEQGTRLKGRGRGVPPDGTGGGPTGRRLPAPPLPVGARSVNHGGNFSLAS